MGDCFAVYEQHLLLIFLPDVIHPLVQHVRRCQDHAWKALLQLRLPFALKHIP